MNFYIFRHGVTFVSKHNLPNYGSEELTAGILPEAFSPSKKLGIYLKKIKTDINLTSPYKRCLDTVKIVSKFSGKEFSIDERLAEYRAGTDKMPEFLERMKNFMDYISNTNNSDVLICSHGYPISAMLQILSSGQIEVAKLDIYPRPGVLSIFKDGNISEIDFND